MLSLFYIPLYIVAFLNIALGLVVLVRNYRNSTNIAFFALAFFVALWAGGLAAFISSETFSQALSWAKLYYVAALGITVSLLFFSATFVSKAKKVNHKGEFFYLFVVIVYSIFLIFNEDFLTSSIVDGGMLGKQVILDKFHYLIYSVIFLYGFTYSISLIYGAYKNARVAHIRVQLKYLTYAVFFASIFAMFFNLILPWFGNYSLIWVGPQFSIIFVAGTALGIVKHKLFDIRLVIVRSLGYVLTLGILVSVFATITTLLARSFSDRESIGIVSSIFNVVMLIIAVLTYPGLKRYFDRVTNKIFYKDAYDPQEFLDQLNKSIVSNIEIGILLRHTTAIIEENLKSSFVQIVVPRTENTAERIAGTKEVKYTDHEINYMRGRLVGLGRKIVNIEDLGSEEDELQKIFNRHDIEALVHLSATSYGQNQTIAFMIFGDKKSGNVYSDADFKIIEIIADELVIAIQNALRFEEIQEFNVTLQNKVNSATNKLRRTNEKLKALDETKDEFISMASHQLRTPLTSVKGYLSMVLEGDAGNVNDEQRKLLDQAFVSSQRMVYLIADLLNVSRLRTGKFVIDAHPANLAVLTEGEVSQLKEQAKSKNIALTYEKPDEFPDLMLDETKTRQVVMNFVDNALYYTPSGGKIDVSVTSDKNHVYFMVKDNGLGVPKDEQKHLFTKFYRAKNARNIRPDGTGLGLFMAKKVITAQGGNILFDSVEGKGSTFGFSFSKKHLAIPETTPVLEEKN